MTLHCRSKKTISNLRAAFYKDDVLMESSPAGKMTINTVSKSDEGLYKCSIPGLGVSPGSWLVVKGKTTICIISAYNSYNYVEHVCSATREQLTVDVFIYHQLVITVIDVFYI